MRRAIIREFEDLAEALSSYNAMFAYRLQNLCVKAEPASLVSVTVMVEGQQQNLEACSIVAQNGDYEFMIIPRFDEDLIQIQNGIMAEHPEFKQAVEQMKVETADTQGNVKETDARYLKLTMPEVDDNRYDVLKDAVKVAYEECKGQMQFANMKADARLAELNVGETKENLDLIKQERDKLNDTWNGQRDKVYNEKLQEIEDAHNKWLTKKEETNQREAEQAAARGDGAGSSMRIEQ